MGPNHVSDVIEISSDDDGPYIAPALKKSKPTRTIKVEDTPTVILKSHKPAKRAVEISRQNSVDKLITITEPLDFYDVPRPGEGNSFAYLLDLRNDEREWKDKSGNFMSIASIVRAAVRSKLIAID